MKWNKSVLSLLFLLFVFSSCGPRKFVIEDGLTANNAKAAIAIHEKQLPKFKTINGKIKAAYKDDENQQSVSINYRIEKDKVIWMSAKAVGLFTVAKLMITPNRVQFYEKITGQYFDGDFQLISSVLGVEIDFEGLQNMLFAQSVYPLKPGKDTAKAEDMAFVFTHQINSFLEQEAKINTKNFTLQQQLVRHKNQIDFLSVNYPVFQKLNKSPFPKEIDILAKKNTNTVQLHIEYRDIRVDEKLSFPFEIPSNYDEIVF
jgi:hypothetical protein